MKRSYPYGALLLIACVSIGGVNRAEAQIESTIAPTRSELEKTEKAATARTEAAISEQRSQLALAGSMRNCRRMAEGMIGVEEKLAQGADLFESGDKTHSRMHSLFREHVLNDTELSQRLAESYRTLQRELLTESIQLCLAAGVSEDDLVKELKTWKLRDGAWGDSFEYVIRRAVVISKEDWAREAGEFAGAAIAAGLAEDVGRRTGLWQHEEGSWSNMFAQLATQLVAEAVIHEVTDPAGRIAKLLQKDILACSRLCIDGKHGFASACRELTQHHLDVRRKLLGLSRKAVK